MYQDVFSATAAGCAMTLIGHPLDTLKVHVQTQPKVLSNMSTFYVAKHLWKSDGPHAFFRGIGPSLASAILVNTAMFTVFRQVKESSQNSLFAGTLSGFVTALITTPTDYVKIQAQLSGIDSVSVFKNIVFRKHPWILFRGNVANLGREGIFTMVYLGLYDICKGEDPGLLWIASSSALTGVLAWAACYPFDTMKTIIQSSTQQLSIRDAGRFVMSRGGISAFYQGLDAAIGRTMLVTSTRMIVYELAQDLFKKSTK
mmetsp:Transcript_4180/g.6520  ORF Transcript_4180/g.6520 Transcript_4180/m.6520 type:complete len:257 (-) Transcript_4180:421-1191(-)